MGNFFYGKKLRKLMEINKTQRFGRYLFIELNGNAYDNGFYYGAVFGKECREVYSLFMKLWKGMLKDYFLPARPFVHLYLIGRIYKKGKRIPVEYGNELKGFIRASGIKKWKVYAMNLFPEIIMSVGCTSVVGKFEKGMIHGRNLDFFPPRLGDFPCITRYKNGNGLAYTVISFLGYFPGLTGLNSGGVSLSLNQSDTANPKKEFSLPVGYLFRDLLGKVSDFAGFRKSVETYRADTGWTLAYECANDGSFAIADFTDGETRINLCPDKKGFLVAENEFVNKEYNKKYKTVLRGGLQSNRKREETVGRMLSFSTDEDRMRKILGSVAYDSGNGKFHEEAGHYTVSNYLTLQSVVMMPGEQAVYLACDHGYASLGKWIKFNADISQVEYCTPVKDPLSPGDKNRLYLWVNELYFDRKKQIRTMGLDIPLTYIEMEYLIPYYKLNKKRLRERREKILSYLDNLLGERPEDIVLYRLSAILCFEGKEYGKGMDLVKKGESLNSPDDTDRFKLFSLGFRMAKKMRDKKLAEHYKIKCRELIEDYAVNKKMRKKLKKFK